MNSAIGLSPSNSLKCCPALHLSNQGLRLAEEELAHDTENLKRGNKRYGKSRVRYSKKVHEKYRLY